MSVPTWDRTHCPLGHEMTPENQRIHVHKGARRDTIECKICVNNRKSAWRFRREPDIDEVVVKLMIDGHYTGLANIHERRLAIQGCDVRGYSAAEIARRVGVTQRTVTRHRRATRDAEVGH